MAGYRVAVKELFFVAAGFTVKVQTEGRVENPPLQKLSFFGGGRSFGHDGLAWAGTGETPVPPV
jgi:hypothetical protein